MDVYFKATSQQDKERKRERGITTEAKTSNFINENGFYCRKIYSTIHSDSNGNLLEFHVWEKGIQKRNQLTVNIFFVNRSEFFGKEFAI